MPVNPKGANRRPQANTPESRAQAARSALILRYAKAIRGYVGSIVPNRQDAEKASQDVVGRLLKGDFAGASSTGGRFRDLLKTAVNGMVSHLSQGPATADRGDSWLAVWTKTVLDHAWAALRDFETAHPKKPAYTLLRLQADFPNDSLEQVALKFHQKTHLSAHPDEVRQMLHRARLKFAELLVDEVRIGLEEPTPARIEEELAALEFLDYVRDFLPADWKKTGILVG